MNASRLAWAQVVQANCHIADARHAGELTLCIYLLQMREFYRWECAAPCGTTLPQADVGAWLSAREALWDEVQAQPWQRLPGGLDAFDAAAANALLAPQGLHYGAGWLGAQQPGFFLAEVLRREVHEGIECIHTGREWARGLLAPPATYHAEPAPQIVLRHDVLERSLWQRLEAYHLRPRQGSALHAVLQGHGVLAAPAQGMARWLAQEVNLALRHELAEHRVGQQLGPAWGSLRHQLPTRRGQALARALRDLLADCGHTLPALLAEGQALAVHGWFAQFEGLREHLHPGLKPAYGAWVAGDGGAALRRQCARAVEHFNALAEAALSAQAGGEPPAMLEARFTAPQAVFR